MMTILVVGAPAAEASTYAEAHPSVEVLAASGNDEALEKLARNRRIDAVLLLPGSEAGALVAELAEEDPSAPPLFAPASVGEIPGVRTLAVDDPDRLLELVVEILESA